MECKCCYGNLNMMFFEGGKKCLVFYIKNQTLAGFVFTLPKSEWIRLLVCW